MKKKTIIHKAYVTVSDKVILSEDICDGFAKWRIVGFGTVGSSVARILSKRAFCLVCK